jgi:hypothetical protein
MRSVVRRIRVIISAFVVAGIFASGVATCTAGALAPEMAQMACCQAGHDDCPMHDSPVDCCKQNSSPPQSHWSVVAKADSLNAPDRVFLMFVTASNPVSDAALLVQPVRAATPSPPLRPVGPPVYIAFSTLLI